MYFPIIKLKTMLFLTQNHSSIGMTWVLHGKVKVVMFWEAKICTKKHLEYFFFINSYGGGGGGSLGNVSPPVSGRSTPRGVGTSGGPVPNVIPPTSRQQQPPAINSAVPSHLAHKYHTVRSSIYYLGDHIHSYPPVDFQATLPVTGFLCPGLGCFFFGF